MTARRLFKKSLVAGAGCAKATKLFVMDWATNGSTTRVRNAREVHKKLCSGQWERFAIAPCLLYRVFGLYSDVRRPSEILKIPHGRTNFSATFIASLRSKKALEQYENTLMSLKKTPILGEHLPRVTSVRRDGGYSSLVIEGINLAEAQADLVNQGKSGLSERKNAFDVAAKTLLDKLSKYVQCNGKLVGDWALHNLIFSDTGVIVNVDAEGFHTYEHAAIENDLGFIRASLENLQTLLKMSVDGIPGRKALSTVAVISHVARSSGTSYNGEVFLPGYHTIKLQDYQLRGQRECSQRLTTIPYDFADKQVIDFGCNIGGMLHPLANDIKAGWGFDFNAECVNAARRICVHNNVNNLEFYTYDFDSNFYSLLSGLIGQRSVDICFLLSVCMWIKDWQRLIQFCASIANSLLFEANGSFAKQNEQVTFLEAVYPTVQQLTHESTDDQLQKNRRLYLCKNES